MSLQAIPLRTTFWTLSQWETHNDLDAYAGHPTHVDIIGKYAPRMAGSTFITWTEARSPGPSWGRARTEIAETRRAAALAHQ